MTRVLLVHPSNRAFVEHEGDRPPLGILYIAAALEAAGDVDVRVLDLTLQSRPDLDDTLRELEPDIVGVTITTTVFPEAAEVATRAKQLLPNATLVAGGPHASALPVETLEQSDFDIVVRGEGERTLLELTRRLAAGETIDDVAGLTYRVDGRVEATPDRAPIESLDDIPFPARHLLPMNEYYMAIDGTPATSIITSRGCPFGCVFCTKKVFGRLLRIRSPENIVDEIEHVVHDFGIRGFLFVDDTFTVHRSRIERVCDLIIEKKLDVIWRCWTRSDQVNQDLLQKMRSAGCTIVCFGIESGDQRVLDKAMKGTKVSTNLQAIRMAKAAGLTVKAFFMVGLPGENDESIENTIRFIDEARPHTADFYLTTPYPGSQIWNHPEELGMKIISGDWTQYYQAGPGGVAPGVIETTDLDRDQLVAAHERLRKHFESLKAGS